MAKAGQSVTEVKEEMVEDDVGKNRDSNLPATENRVLQVLAAPPKVTNAIANWSKRSNVTIIPDIERCICVNRLNMSFTGFFCNLESSGHVGFLSSLTGMS